MIFKTNKLGIELEVQKVNQNVLSELLSGLTKSKNIRDVISSGDIDSLSSNITTTDEALDAVGTSFKLFNYCAGWGVVNNPPEEIPELIELLDINTNKPHIYRSAWIRFCLELDEEELSELIGMIIGITFNDEPIQRRTSPKKKKKKNKRR